MLRLEARRVKTAKGESVVWYIKGTCRLTGEYFRTSTRCHRKSDAEVVLITTNERQRQKAVFGRSAGLATFGEAVVEYLAKGGEARFLTPLVDKFGEIPLRNIEDTDLTAGASEHYPKAANSTLVRQWYGPFQAVWTAAAGAKLVQDRHWKKPKVKKTEVDFPGDDWLERVISACTRLQQRAVILFMSFSGLRASEVARVKSRNYNRETAVIVVGKTKVDARSVALPPFVHAVLSMLPVGQPDDLLFGYASRFSITRIIKRSCKRAGVQYFSPHKAGRHAFAARFLADRNSLKALMEAGGWSSVAAVMRYAHLEMKTVDAAVAGVTTPLAGKDLIGTLTGTAAARSKQPGSCKIKKNRFISNGAAKED